MWECPDCERVFKSPNQYHICTDTTVDDIFKGRPDRLILAFDALLASVIDWQPCHVGTSTKSIVFTKKTAWLIVKPMSKELDLKFYYPEKLRHRLLHKVTSYGNKYAHHIRISDDAEITTELLELLRKGFDWK